VISLTNQVVVITGSSRGFGYAMAKEFLLAGARVVISSRDPESVKSAVSALPDPDAALGVPCDVRELEQVKILADAAIRRFGRIDIWINNAGLAHPYVKMLQIDPGQWRASFGTNFLGAYNGCLVAMQEMLPRRSGQIINVLGFGADRPSPNQSAYGASKAALWQLTQTLAQEYAGTGVSINAVMPGMIWTEMLTRAEGADDPRLRTRMEWAMRVFGNPPEVPARFVVQMASKNTNSGRMLRLLTPRVFVPRMIAEFLGAGRRNPRPWEK
jgi:NAD(P)-dependent dehydrogenase (short-subunit alcohol dehydrogenase family)